ncbi:MAG: hypothetical protein L6R48_23670 [Planctomycetes bacterium]|nr:hypothetical protein [Planctomycetota bacterium]
MSWHIDTDFAGANACAPSLACAGGIALASIAADPRGSPEALWFRLRLRRLAHQAPAPLLELRDPGLLLGAGDGGALRPAVRCDRGAWTRLGPGTPATRADGGQAVRWALPDAAAMIEVALCQPYGAGDLERLLGEAAGALHLDAIGVSGGGRPLLRVSNHSGDADSQRPGIYVLARQHAGEVPGSWVLDGLLRRLAALGARAPLVWAVPFADTDGVARGDYGKDGFPLDLNRAWWQQPRRREAAVIMADIARWRTRCAPRLCLDLHAPGAAERAGVYAFTAIGGAPAPAAASAWAARLGPALGAAAAADFARQGDYPSRFPLDLNPCFTAWADAQGLPALALEISYLGKDEAVWGAQEWRAAGAALADGLAAP